MSRNFRLVLAAQALLLLLENGSACLAAKPEEQSWQVFKGLGDKASQQLNWHKSQQLYRLALQEAENSGEKKDLPELLSLLANSYCQLDEADKALPLYEKAFTQLRSNGASTNQLAQAMLSLAAVYESLGKHSKAEPLYRSVLTGNFSESAQVAEGLHKLGMAYYKRGQIAKSRQVLGRASAILDRVDNNSEAALSCKADYLQSLGRKGSLHAPVLASQPQPQSQQALPPPLVRIDADQNISASDAVPDRGLPPNQPPGSQSDVDEAARLLDKDPTLPLNPLFSTLSDVFYRQRRFGAAEPLYKKIISIDETTLGPDYPATGYDVNNLALLYLSQGRIKDAAPLLERALHIFQKNYGQENLAVVRCQANLASVYTHDGQYEAAKTLLDNALASSNKLLGVDSFESGSILNKIGYLYYKQNNYEQASNYYEKAVTTLKGSSGASGKMVAASLTDYARSLRAQNRSQEASEAEQQARNLLTSKSD